MKTSKTLSLPLSQRWNDELTVFQALKQRFLRRKKQSGSPEVEAPQLVMRRYHLQDLPDSDATSSFEIRTYKPGDEQAWAEIMNTGFGSQRTASDVIKEFIDQPQFVADGVFFALDNELPVGSAFAWRDSSDEWKHGRLEMVCVLPSHRGHNLGYWLTLRVLQWFNERGFEDVELTTDDWRLAAVKQYLNLGFEPVVTDDITRSRWLKILEQLQLSSYSLPSAEKF